MFHATYAAREAGMSLMSLLLVWFGVGVTFTCGMLTLERWILRKR